MIASELVRALLNAIERCGDRRVVVDVAVDRDYCDVHHLRLPAAPDTSIVVILNDK